MPRGYKSDAADYPRRDSATAITRAANHAPCAIPANPTVQWISRIEGDVGPVLSQRRCSVRDAAPALRQRRANVPRCKRGRPRAITLRSVATLTEPGDEPGTKLGGFVFKKMLTLSLFNHNKNWNEMKEGLGHLCAHMD